AAPGEVWARFWPEDCQELVAGGAGGVDGEVDEDLDAGAAPDAKHGLDSAVDDGDGRLAEHGEFQRPMRRRASRSGAVPGRLSWCRGGGSPRCRRLCGCRLRVLVVDGVGLTKCVQDVDGRRGVQDVEAWPVRRGMVVDDGDGGGAVDVDVPDW